MTRELQTFLKTTLLLLFLATASLQAGSMSAQEAIDKAIDYKEQNNYRGTIKYLLISYNAKPDIVVAGNLGLAYEEIKDYPNAIKWYKKVFEMGDSNGAVDLALLYKKKLKDYPNAIKWYKKAYQAGNSTGALYLALLYDETLKDYPKAIEWYKKAYAMGNKDGARDLAIFYRKTLKDYPKAIEWYSKGVKEGYGKSINGLAYLYYDKKDYVKATAYILLTINYGYGDTQSTLKYLKDEWNVDDATILKAYEFQKTIDVPKHYYNEAFEKELHSNQSNTSKQEEPTHHRHGDK